MLRGVLYFKIDKLYASLAPTFRGMGQNLFRQGLAMQGDSAHEDRIVPSMRCIPISDAKYPKVLGADWVAPNATVIGDVKLAEGSSIWHGTIVRGDTASVSIGKNSIVQDNTRIASNQNQPGDKVTIGENVQVGANSRLDACTLDNFAFVGMGASVHRGARVESFGVLSAGGVLEEGVTVPSG